MNGIVQVGTANITEQQNFLTEDLYINFIRYLDVKPKSLETYERAIRQFAYFLKVRGITAPTREDIILYREELKKDHKPTTVQNYLTACKLFFKWTAQEGIYPNVAEHIKGVKIDKSHKKSYLTASQLTRVLKGTRTDTEAEARDYAIFLLLSICGLRTIEVVRANIEDLDMIGETTVLYIQGKGRDEKTDYVIIPDKVEEAIRGYLVYRGRLQKGNALFTSTSNNNRGQRMTTRTVSGIAKEKMRKAGYDNERLTAHSLRHTAVTLSLLGGANIEEAQEFARHKDIGTTMIYNHSLKKENNRCTKIIETAIFGA